jgi:hypothetical protein
MIFLLVLGAIAAAFLLYVTDRVIKARGKARQVRKLSGRLAAATARAERQQARQQAAVVASGALTSMVPAINHPSYDADPAASAEAGAAKAGTDEAGTDEAGRAGA